MTPAIMQKGTRRPHQDILFKIRFDWVRLDRQARLLVIEATADRRGALSPAESWAPVTVTDSDLEKLCLS
jgi:hypothetical protein